MHINIFKYTLCVNTVVFYIKLVFIDRLIIFFSYKTCFVLAFYSFKINKIFIMWILFKAMGVFSRCLLFHEHTWALRLMRSLRLIRVESCLG